MQADGKETLEVRGMRAVVKVAFRAQLEWGIERDLRLGVEEAAIDLGWDKAANGKWGTL